MHFIKLTKSTCVLLTILCVFSGHLSAQCPKLVWSDEFAGTSLDLTKWSYQLGDGCDINLCQWGNNELQWYKENNVEVSNNTLKITAKKETFQNRNYTSGRIRSLGKGDFKYGRIEARMKMPVGKGLWPAFWMLPSDNVYGGWPQSGEIDILEYLGHEKSTILGTIHYGMPWPNNSYSTKTFTLVQGGFNDAFHVYAIEWTENEIKWLIDGYLYSTKTRADVGSLRWPFDQKFYVLLNMAVGGNLPGNPFSTTEFPQTFEVDYVRVYDMTGAYLTGSQKVPFMAKNVAYSLANVPTGSNVVWTIPAGATVVSGAGTKDLVINWGSVGGKVLATVNNACGESKYELIVQVEASLSTSIVLENFDKEARIIKTFNSGEFTDNFPTPSPNDINRSALSGKYVRNLSQQYDVLIYDISDVNNGADFTTSDKKFYIDINTNAPIGTTILLQLENKSQAQGNNYPLGRHSRYSVTTTKQNEWHRLAFEFMDKPDVNVSNQAVSQLILLFAPNTNNGSTFYFDNFDIYAKNVASTADIEREYGIQMSPNPAKEGLRLSVSPSKTIAYVEIVDAAGKVVGVQKNILKSESVINIQSLPAGMYFLHMGFTDTRRFAKSFVKE